MRATSDATPNKKPTQHATRGTRQGNFVLWAVSLVGVAAFLGPFFLSGAQTDAGAANRAAHAADAPLVFAALGLCCLVALLIETGGRDPDAKAVALLGVLVATNAALRLVPGVLGASPIFFLPVCVGYVWGPRFGFLHGAGSLALSAAFVGGFGPWLPFQMLALGWVGMTAGLLPGSGEQHADGTHRFHRSPLAARRSLLLLAIFAGAWGFGYGAIMNLWFWPFAAPAAPAEAGLYWSPGLGLAETIRRYATFYLATSAVYDGFRAGGNVLMVLAFGRPTLLLLGRFRRRFTWQPVESLPGR